MKVHSDSALATVLLTTHVVKRSVKPLTTKEYWDLVARLDDPASLIGVPADAIARKLAISAGEAERTAELLDSATLLAIEIEHLEQSGIMLVTPFDESYPVRLLSRLGPAAPPVLHVAGSPRLLGEDGIGIVGSRNVGKDARAVAEAIAKQVAGAGLSVISGVARGIDQVAMAAAFEAEGNVIGIPADAMSKLLRDPSVRKAITSERLCIATPYGPSTGFSVGNAMGRNKLIYAMSRTTVVITSEDGTGGTWSGAVEAIDKGFAPVSVWTGPGAGKGNERLVARGGISLSGPAQVLDIAREPSEMTTVDSKTQLRLQL